MAPGILSCRFRELLRRCMQFGVLLLLLSHYGCAWLIKPPVDQAPARQLVETSAHMNAGLNQYKGLAQAHLVAEGQVIQGRIALAAVAPNQMRVEWLSALGQPLTSLAGDGERITVRMHDSGKVYRLPQQRTSLERMVHIPIGISDLLSILAGRPPLPEYAAAQLEPNPDRDVRVVLKNRWRGILATLQMDRDNGRAKVLKTFDSMGILQYEVHWSKWQVQGAYAIPRQVVIRTPAQQILTLTMNRFWPDADVDPGTFVLAPPDQNV